MHDDCEKCSSNANETSGKNSSNSKKMHRKLPIYNLQLIENSTICPDSKQNQKKNFT